MQANIGRYWNQGRQLVHPYRDPPKREARHVLAFDIAGSLRPLRNVVTRRVEALAEPPPITATIGIAGCCARTASGQANAVPPSLSHRNLAALRHRANDRRSE